MVRAHGLDPEGRTCAACGHRATAKAKAGRPYHVSVCLLRSRTPAGLNNPRHRATWDACALVTPRTVAAYAKRLEAGYDA